MHSIPGVRQIRVLFLILAVLVAAGCGEGDGKQPIAGTPAPPPPPAFCFEAVTFELVCDPVTITNFEGGVITVVDNPDQGMANPSDKVAQMQKFAAESGATFGGTTLALPDSLTVSAGSRFTAKVWSQRAVRVLLQPEPQGPGSGIEIMHNGTGWEELSFSLPSLAGSVSGITLIFDNGTLGAAGTDEPNWTFYIDDITLVPAGGGGGSAAEFPEDFEGDPASYDFGMDGGFGGGASDVIANPDASGINTSAQVARMQKFAGEVFGGSTLTLAGDVDFSAGEVFTVKVWATRAVPVLFKFEGLDQERSVTHSGSGGWEELCFDFSGTTSGPASSAISFIFDLGVNGDATNDPNNWTFYFDDIEQAASCPGSGGGGGNTGGITFEPGETGSGFTWATFENDDNPPVQLITNPDQSGANTSATVAQFTARAGGQPFAGAETAHGDIGPITLDSTNSFVRIMVWKSVISDVGLKFAIANGGAQPEIKVANTAVNQWEELTFDFSAYIGLTEAIDIDQLIVFPDFAARGQDNVVYFDNITFGDASGSGGGSGGGGTATSFDFEGAGPFNFSDFGGGAATVVANPDATGINTSATVGQMQKFAGEVFGGSTLDLGGDVDWSAGEVFTIKVMSSRVVDLLFKLEGLNQERSATHGGTGWELLCFDFSGTTAGAPANGITLIFDLGVNGDAANDPDNWTFQFDDIEQAASCPGSGGGAATIDFEDDPNSYDFGADGGFGGGAASVVDNPDASGINTSAQVGQMLKFDGEIFGGATLMLATPIDIPAGNNFTMKVWSQRAVPVLFKLEGGPVAETTVNHTGSGWEQLTFDFAAVSGAITGITLIFDLGVNGAAATDPTNWTFYFDDIELTAAGGGSGGGGGTIAGDPIDFEAAGVGAGFTWATFENDDNPPVAIIANPDQSGANTSATVAQFTARAGGQPFAGAETAHGDIGPITLDSSNSIVKVMVWKPVISDVGIKFAIANGGAQPEIKVANTLVNQWEELTFDFTGNIGLVESIDIDQLIIFPDFAARSQDNVVYFDSIIFTDGGGGGGGGGGTPTATLVSDFEDAGAPYTFGDFGGGAATVVDNPDMSGINTSAKTGEMIKFAGEVFGGSTLSLAAPIDIVSGTSFTMKVWSQRAVPVLFKLEGGPVGEVEANHGGAGWEELTFDFGTLAGSGVNGITLIFDLGVNGAAATDPASWTFYFDDITVNSP